MYNTIYNRVYKYTGYKEIIFVYLKVLSVLVRLYEGITSTQQTITVLHACRSTAVDVRTPKYPVLRRSHATHDQHTDRRPSSDE